MDKNKKLSIIIPVYNVEKYLEKCIASVLTALEGNEDVYEIILVNDGSPDGCDAICKKFQKQYEHIKHISQSNQGVSVARNNGIAVAEGEYLTFIDPDDWVSKEMADVFRLLLNCQNNEVEMFCMAAKKVDKDDNIIGDYNFGIMATSSCLKIIKRSFIIDNNLLFKAGVRHAEDVEWTSRIMLCSPAIVFSKINYYRYFANREESATKKIGIEKISEIIELLSNAFDDIEKSDKGGKAKKMAKRVITNFSLPLFSQVNNLDEAHRQEAFALFKKHKYLFKKPYKRPSRYYVVWALMKVFGFKITANVLKRVYKTPMQKSAKRT